MENFIKIFDSIKTPLFAIISALMGTFFGYKFGVKQLVLRKRLEFIEKQIKEFYSPMVSLVTDINSKIKLTNKISKISDEEWSKIFKGLGPREYEILRKDNNIVKFSKIFDYHKEEFLREIFPSYKKMLEIFREKFWLALPETRKWYNDFSDFIGIWDRHLEKSLPLELGLRIGHAGKELVPFFENLSKTLDFLLGKLEKGKP